MRVGQPIFQENCAGCHTATGVTSAGRTTPSVPTLQEFTPERVYEALTVGKMQTQAAPLSDVQKRQIAEWLGGRPIASGDRRGLAAMTNRCTSNPPLRDPASAPSWNGWGRGTENARFQPAAAAGLDAASVPKLAVKWAFGVPDAVEMYSQPAIVSGRVFFSSDNAVVYSIDADSGCVYWASAVDASVRTAPIVAPINGRTATRYAVFLADGLSRVYALDAQTGALLWKTRASEHPRAKLTGSPTYYDHRLYVPVSSMETTGGAVLSYECCTGRGHVVAIDSDSGAVVWRSYMIPEEPKPRGKNKQGVTLWGPSGAAVWNAPTIDPKRHLVYVGTGNAYTFPAADTTDSIVALDMDTGRIAWHYQDVQGDAFLGSCGPRYEEGSNCPEKLGPDWDFGGASLILRTLPDGRDVLVGASKGGIVAAVDPDRQGQLVWRPNLAEQPPNASGLIVFGGAADDEAVYVPLQRPGGGLAAVRLKDGARLWTAAVGADRRGQSAAATVIPGAVFTGGWDGILRAYSTRDGQILWQYNSAHAYETVNGIDAKGGSLAAPGPVVVGGMLFVTSGYVGVQNGSPGNVLLAFSAQ
jgi:polyvinyl alcohol dehydrogenase (cytochrome)